MKQGVGVGRKCFRVGVSLRELDTICKTTEVGFPRLMKITAHAANGIYYFIDIIELLAIFEILPKEKSAAIKKSATSMCMYVCVRACVRACVCVRVCILPKEKGAAIEKIHYKYVLPKKMSAAIEKIRSSMFYCC